MVPLSVSLLSRPVGNSPPVIYTDWNFLRVFPIGVGRSEFLVCRSEFLACASIGHQTLCRWSFYAGQGYYAEVGPLLEELLQDDGLAQEPDGEDDHIMNGTQVTICGLKSAQQWNGSSGRVMKQLGNGRFEVRLSGGHVLSVKRDNFSVSEKLGR